MKSIILLVFYIKEAWCRYHSIRVWIETQVLVTGEEFCTYSGWSKGVAFYEVKSSAVAIQNDKNNRIWFKARSVLPGSFPKHEFSFSENELGSKSNGDFWRKKLIQKTSKFIFRKWKFMFWKRTWKHTSRFKSYPIVLVILDRHSATLYFIKCDSFAPSTVRAKFLTSDKNLSFNSYSDWMIPASCFFYVKNQENDRLQMFS